MTVAPLMQEPSTYDRLLAPLEHFAASAPGRIALMAGGSPLTAGELELRSTRLAGRLLELGITPASRVGIGLDRSSELVVAILAVVKTGAAYVPLDPSYPRERLAHMISSAGTSLVLSRTGLIETFKAAGATQVLDLTAEPALSPSSPHPLLPPISPDFPLYAIFTSGSTGQPKAASVLRRNFLNLLDWYTREMRLGPDDTTLVISSPSFDLTQKNFFAPLLTGGRLVLDDSAIYDISRISRLIREHRVTVLNCTPSAFYPLVDAAAASSYADLASLRFAVLGGEPISIPRLRAWLEHPSCKAEVMNSYGPTECADICAFHRLHRGNLDDFPFVPLGREIPNVTVTIRDEDLAPLPDGELGELCIAGAGLGAGYIGDPEKTRRAFALAHSLYRTGDLARRLPCGTLEFRGRADHQVKVNGFRIELGEIEIALGQHAGVREAVVLAQDGRLIAHVQASASAAELKQHLLEKLPAYMVPGEFVFRESFPLTPNGKIDRLALTSEDRSDPTDPTDLPSTTPTARILTLWSEILGHPVTDPDANFFDLGGTSIHLAVVHVRLREISGRDLAITDLFARPSARALAELLAPQAIPSSSATQDRARLQRAGFSNFRRPSPR
jgi:amino acid adenylation domain-containing protein